MGDALAVQVNQGGYHRPGFYVADALCYLGNGHNHSSEDRGKNLFEHGIGMDKHMNACFCLYPYVRSFSVTRYLLIHMMQALRLFASAAFHLAPNAGIALQAGSFFPMRSSKMEACEDSDHVQMRRYQRLRWRGWHANGG
ncbi:hypothetical protein SAMN05192566_1588 [Methylophilus rhizosphaerae]|uniref:Uncharacterized protein n=1 Tax=Methylophilus rhizosphaerae TaxID=492660 RepID=A0A1G9CS14_9PROT|nr:hypothetical protein [Methylophilus rhizosphaerae]SDK54204.1 hypothetical protein SAMN05192566_1588 [Methylophilus rhizosphaerae]